MTTLSHHDLQWILIRCPKRVLELLKAHPLRCFMAGGFIRACIAREPVNDIDLFCSSAEEAGSLAMELADNDPKRLYKTDNAITVRGYGLPIQIVHRWTFAVPEQCIRSFDFTIAAAALWAIDSKTENPWHSILHETYYADLAAKRLVYTAPDRNEEAGGSMLRVLKFYQRGYRIPLSSLGSVIARLFRGLPQEKIDQLDGVSRGVINRAQWEEQVGQMLTGLLREVDPAIDPNHIAHLPDPTMAQPEPEPFPAV